MAKGRRLRVVSKTILVTPKMASKWLRENNNFNRHVSQALVDKIALSILAGNFHYGAESISFDYNGELVNGQHRLYAIVKAGVAVRMVVTWGVSPESRLFVDGGRSRSLSDQATLSGHPMTKDHAGVLRMMLSKGNSIRLSMPNDKLVEMYEEYRDAIDFAVHRPRKRIRKLTRAAVLAPIARAWFSQNRDRLAEFIDVLRDGIVRHGLKDHAVITMRSFLLERGHGTFTSAGHKEVYFKTEAAIRAFLKGKKLGKLQVVHEELFPIPGDENWKPVNEQVRKKYSA